MRWAPAGTCGGGVAHQVRYAVRQRRGGAGRCPAGITAAGGGTASA